jgi:tetratricopeptide (TPR) repeat protein
MNARSVTVAPVGRSIAALALLATIGLGVGYFQWKPVRDLPPEAMPSRAVDHESAAASQSAFPTTQAEALAGIDNVLAFDLERTRAGGGWLNHAMVGNGYLSRAKLTGSFDDYRRAGDVFARAFAVADPGFGPHLDRAGFNMTVHRLAAVEPDLARIDGYAVPVDDATRAVIIALRGDLQFYRGHYAEALKRYEEARTLDKSMQASFRLANYWSAMGDTDLALRYLGEAESDVAPRHQQVLALIENQRGVIALRRGAWDEAERHFRRAERIFPGHPPIEERIASVMALKGDAAGAMAIYQRIAAQFESPEAMDAIAGLYRAQGDQENARVWAGRAEAIWNRRLAMLPEAAYGHALDHFLAFGDPARALAIARRNYALRPYAEAAIGLAWALIANRKPAEALAVIEPVLASDWVSAEQHIAAAQAYALLGRGEEADAERGKAFAINPRSFDRNPGLLWLEQ